METTPVYRLKRFRCRRRRSRGATADVWATTSYSPWGRKTAFVLGGGFFFLEGGGRFVFFEGWGGAFFLGCFLVFFRGH